MTGRLPIHFSQMGAKRKYCTLTNLVNTMLDTTELSKEWLGEVILIACHVLNCVPTKNKHIMPFEEWETKRLTHSYLRTWGYLAKVHVLITKHKRKFGPKIVDCVFLSYAIHSIGYRFLIVKYGDLMCMLVQSWSPEMLHF
jgi:hypothetical protein